FMCGCSQSRKLVSRDHITNCDETVAMKKCCRSFNFIWSTNLEARYAIAFTHALTKSFDIRVIIFSLPSRTAGVASNEISVFRCGLNFNLTDWGIEALWVVI
ncbi:MAG: hypothetical protein ACKPAF_07225, partial [Actinomycetota bacterium]